MIPCVIESPFAGANKAEESRNRAYLEKCIRWCVKEGFTPYASHKMLTNALDDSDPGERDTGIRAGLEMSEAILSSHPRAQVFIFTDYGMSRGMKFAVEHYKKANRGGEINFAKVGKL